MKTNLTLALIAALAMTHPALAQTGLPGAHFVENWDLDGDGQVTLAEATERRGDIFASFDEDEDGILQPAEHDVFDQARADDMQASGAGTGHGRNNPANGMMRRFTDADGDGNVTRGEFMAAVPGWFARMDRDGDGAVTTGDFARH